MPLRARLGPRSGAPRPASTPWPARLLLRCAPPPQPPPAASAGAGPSALDGPSRQAGLSSAVVRSAPLRADLTRPGAAVPSRPSPHPKAPHCKQRGRLRHPHLVAADGALHAGVAAGCGAFSKMWGRWRANGKICTQAPLLRCASLPLSFSLALPGLACAQCSLPQRRRCCFRCLPSPLVAVVCLVYC